jgi:hypothetical protein
MSRIRVANEKPPKHPHPHPHTGSELLARTHACCLLFEHGPHTLSHVCSREAPHCMVHANSAIKVSACMRSS